jgi:uncharacterized membrane protein YczE
VLPSRQPPRPLPHRRPLSRLSRLLAGLGLLGTGIAVMVLAGLGLGPWDVLHQGLAERTGLAIGTASILVSALVLATWLPLRERPGIGTLANAVLVGVVIDAWLAWVPPPAGTAARVALMLAGTPVLAAGVGLYLSADLGPGPRDGVMTGLVRRGHPTWVVRSGIEATALLAGWLLGGTVGVGTLVSVVTIGPLVHLSLECFGATPPTARAPTATAGRPDEIGCDRP